jgi:hypothetical protein
MTKRDKQASEYAAESYEKSPTERGVSHMSGALTDAEREAIDGAVWDYGQYADEMGLSVAEVTERQNTLRSLLERLS